MPYGNDRPFSVARIPFFRAKWSNLSEFVREKRNSHGITTNGTVPVALFGETMKSNGHRYSHLPVVIRLGRRIPVQAMNAKRSEELRMPVPITRWFPRRALGTSSVGRRSP